MGIEACRPNSGNGNTDGLDCHDTGSDGNGDNRITRDEANGAAVSEADYNAAGTRLRDGGNTYYRLANVTQHPSPTTRPAYRPMGSTGISAEGAGSVDTGGAVAHSGGVFRIRVEHDFAVSRRVSILASAGGGYAWRTAQVSLPGGNSGESSAGGPHVRLDIGGRYYVLDRAALGTLSVEAGAFAGLTFVDETEQPLRAVGAPPENCQGSASECTPEASGPSNTGLRGIAVVDGNGTVRNLAPASDTLVELGGRLSTTWTMPWRPLGVAPFARLFVDMGTRWGGVSPTAGEFAGGGALGFSFGGNLNGAPADQLTRLRGVNLNPDQNVEQTSDGLLRVFVPNNQLGGNSGSDHTSVTIASTMDHWEPPVRLGGDGISATGVHVDLVPNNANIRLGVGATYLVRQDDDHVVRPFVVTPQFAERFNGNVARNADNSVTLRPLGGLTSFPAGSTLVAVGQDGKPLAATATPALASTLAQNNNSFSITSVPDGTVAFRVIHDGTPVQQTNVQAAAAVTVVAAPPPRADSVQIRPMLILPPTESANNNNTTVAAFIRPDPTNAGRKARLIVDGGTPGPLVDLSTTENANLIAPAGSLNVSSTELYHVHTVAIEIMGPDGTTVVNHIDGPLPVFRYVAAELEPVFYSQNPRDGFPRQTPTVLVTDSIGLRVSNVPSDAAYARVRIGSFVSDRVEFSAETAGTAHVVGAGAFTAARTTGTTGATFYLEHPEMVLDANTTRGAHDHDMSWAEMGRVGGLSPIAIRTATRGGFINNRQRSWAPTNFVVELFDRAGNPLNPLVMENPPHARAHTPTDQFQYRIFFRDPSAPGRTHTGTNTNNTSRRHIATTAAITARDSDGDGISNTADHCDSTPNGQSVAGNGPRAGCNRNETPQ